MKRLVVIFSVVVFLFGCGTSTKSEEEQAVFNEAFIYQIDVSIYIAELSLLLSDLTGLAIDLLDDPELVLKEGLTEEVATTLSEIEKALGEGESMVAPDVLESAGDDITAAIEDYRFVVDEYMTALENRDEAVMQEILTKLDTGAIHLQEASKAVEEYFKEEEPSEEG